MSPVGAKAETVSSLAAFPGLTAKEVNFCCRYRPSVEVAIEKLVQAVTCIVRCLAVLFHPVIKQGHAGLEVRVIESVVRAGIDNELDWRPVVAPAGDFIGAVRRRRPIVEGPNEDKRGYPRTRHGLLTWRIEAAAARNRKLLGGANSSNE